MFISSYLPRWLPACGSGTFPYSRRPREKRPQADQVVGRCREGHDPIDKVAAAMAELAQTADRLQPAEDLLDQFPFLLTDRIARMPCGPLVDRAALDLLRDMRRDAERAHAGDETGDVEALITADRCRVGGG